MSNEIAAIRHDVNDIDHAQCANLNRLLDWLTVLGSPDAPEPDRDKAWAALLTDGVEALMRIDENNKALIQKVYEMSDHYRGAQRALERAVTQRERLLQEQEDLNYALENLDKDHPVVAQVIKDALNQAGLVDEDDAWGTITTAIRDALRYSDVMTRYDAVERFVERVRDGRLSSDEMSELAVLIRRMGAR